MGLALLSTAFNSLLFHAAMVLDLISNKRTAMLVVQSLLVHKPTTSSHVALAWVARFHRRPFQGGSE